MKKKREALIRHFISLHPHDEHVLQPELLEHLVKETKGWNVADLRKLINDAATCAAKDEREVISNQYLKMALIKWTPSPVILENSISSLDVD